MEQTNLHFTSFLELFFSLAFAGARKRPKTLLNLQLLFTHRDYRCLKQLQPDDPNRDETMWYNDYCPSMTQPIRVNRKALQSPYDVNFKKQYAKDCKLPKPLFLPAEGSILYVCRRHGQRLLQRKRVQNASRAEAMCRAGLSKVQSTFRNWEWKLDSLLQDKPR